VFDLVIEWADATGVLSNCGAAALPNPLAAMTGDGYAMNAADLAGGSFSSGSLASNNLTMASISNSPAPKMIPVPGLPSQQNLQQQQQANLQQQIQQRNNLQQQSNNGLAPRNQQQQLGQLSNNQSLYQSQGQQSSGLGGQQQAAVLKHKHPSFYSWNVFPSFMTHSIHVIIVYIQCGVFRSMSFGHFLFELMTV